MYVIPKTEVLRYLGYRGQEISDELDRQIDKLIKKATTLCLPQFTHMVCDVEFLEKGISLTGTSIVLTGKDIYDYLKGAKKCIVLACTLGSLFETEFLRLQKKSVTEAVIFDAVGSSYIECFTDDCEKKLVEPQNDNGYFFKYRYSPGYGDLPIELQHDILSALSAEKRIGLTATDTNILIPRKSVTAFIGIFDKPQAKSGVKCERCSGRDFCKMKKEGFSCD